jgi:acyl-CoA oxidase
LLGELEKRGDPGSSFFEEIHRISVGSLALSLVNVPTLKAAAYLVHMFSRRRLITHLTTELPAAILSFPTQYGPIILATIHATMMESAGRVSIGAFQTSGEPDMLRAALTYIFKATVT